MNDCVFCRIAAGEVPAHMVLEDEATVAFLDARPVFKGHVLVVDEQDPDAHPTPAWAGVSGNVATTSKPPPCRGPAATDPPYIATRSRIPVRPCPVDPGIGAPPRSPRPSSLIASISAASE